MRTPAPCVLPTRPTPGHVLVASGITAAMIRTQLSAGRLVRLRKGVYVAASAVPTDPAARHLLDARAEQTYYPRAVISHESAAVVWGLPHPGTSSWDESVPTVTLPTDDGSVSRGGPARHRVAQLPAGHVTQDAEGYAVTTVARTATDLCVGLSVPESLVLLDAAARRVVEAIVTPVRRADYANERRLRAARELLADAASVRRSAALARAVALADPRRESPAESLSAGHFHLAGLPEPEFQHAVRTPFGIFYPDCYWPEQRLIGECDGAVKYTDPTEIVREKRREQWLRDEGNRFVRWLGAEIVYTPDLVVARVGRALGR